MAKLKSTYVAGGLTVEGPVVASQFATIKGEGNVTVASNITGNANVIPKFATNGAFSVVKSTISDDGTNVTITRDLNCRLVRESYADQATISGGIVFRANNTTNNYLRVCNSTSAIRTFLGIGTTNDVTFKSVTASLNGNATSATTATKLGSSNVGSGTVPMYLSAGAPTASTSTVGGTTTPVYLNAGRITAGTALGTAAYRSANQNLNTTSAVSFSSVSATTFTGQLTSRISLDPTSFGLTLNSLTNYTPPTDTIPRYNTAAGYEALLNLDPTAADTTALYNTAFGGQALKACTTGSYNTAVGKAALYSCSTGDSNVAVGAAAGTLVTTHKNTLCLGAGTAIGTISTSYPALMNNQVNINNLVRVFYCNQGGSSSVKFYDLWQLLNPYINTTVGTKVSCIGRLSTRGVDMEIAYIERVNSGALKFVGSNRTLIISQGDTSSTFSTFCRYTIVLPVY